MLLISGISLVILGIMAVPTLFLPDRFANKVLPYRSYLGIIFIVVGIMEIILSFFNLDLLYGNPFVWILVLICSVAKINLGVMLGQNVIMKIFSGRDANAVNMSKKYVDFILFKSIMGIIGMGLGFFQIVTYFIC